MKVLLAEDEPAARENLAALLARWGYEVTAVADGAAAWEILCQEGGPRLALLDWMMPGLDGVDVCRRAREQCWADPPYIILLTARGGEEDLVAGLEAGADEYVAKPVSLPELRARLQAGQRIVDLQASLAGRVRQLEEALADVKQLHGLLPICSYCKKVRDDQNYWQQVEEYIGARTAAEFSHSICPDCYQNIVQPELAKLDAAAPEEAATPQATGPVGVEPETTNDAPVQTIAPGPPPGMEEHRARTRMPGRGQVGFNRQCELGTAPVRDISTGGVCLLLPHSVEPGEVLNIELFNRAGNFWHLKPLRVVHATPMDERRWLVGGAFVRELSTDQLQAVGG
jgi:CheY-like chemotaxis protein